MPDVEYTFKHSLTRDVAYDSVPADRRRGLHARIVEAIERLYPERLAEQIERLADHALRGEVWAKAVTYLHQAGAKALARFAYREAVRRLEQALGALAHVPQDRKTIEQAIDVRLELRNALWSLAVTSQVFAILRDADALARAINDRRRLGWVSVHLTNYFLRYGQHDRAVESGRQALTIAREVSDFDLQIGTATFLGHALRVLGQYPEAIDLLEANLQALHGDRLSERFGQPILPSVSCRNWLAWCRTERGEFTEALAIGDDGIRIAESTAHPFSVAIALFSAGYVRVRRGAFQQAIPLLERGVATCQAWQIESQLPALLAVLGYAYALDGRGDEALPLLEPGSKTPLVHRALFTAFLGEANLLAGHTEEALSVARQALALTRDRKERGHEAWTLRLLGEIHAYRDPPDVEVAEGHYHESLAIAEELGMRPLVAHSHLGLGTLASRTGDYGKARRHLTTATAMYREMGMNFWPERAEAALDKIG
jgi:tetratricopeptide (TPR) repeat protein